MRKLFSAGAAILAFAGMLAAQQVTALQKASDALGVDKIEQRITANPNQAVRPEQRFDLLARSAAEERQPVADPGILGARSGILRRRAGPN